MRILHVIDSIASQRGGPTFALQAMTKEALDLGHPCVVVATDFDLEAQPPYGFSSELEIIVFKSLDKKQYPLSFSMGGWLYKNVKKFDLVHIHTFFTFSTLAGAWAASQFKIPYIVRPLGTLDPWSLSQKSNKKRLFIKTVGKKILDSAHGIHVTSPQEEKNLRAFGKALPIYNVPLGVALPATYDSSVTQEGPLKLLYLSRIHPKKNIPTLLRAMEKLINQGHKIELMLAGGGEEIHLQPIREMVAQLNLKEIHLCGFVEGEEKEKLLKEADVFVLPSFQENFGIAVVEGMAYGKPVLISDAIALADEVAACGAGLTFSPENEDALMNSIIEMKSAALRASCGENGRKLVAEKYSMAGLGGRLEQMYKHLLSQK